MTAAMEPAALAVSVDSILTVGPANVIDGPPLEAPARAMVAKKPLSMRPTLLSKPGTVRVLEALTSGWRLA